MRDLRIYLFFSFTVWVIPFSLCFILNGPATTNKKANKNFVNKNYYDIKKSNAVNRIVINRNLNQTFWTILTNNTKVGLLNISGGVVLGVSTFINLLVNGFSLATAMRVALSKGIPLKFIIESLLAPHIIELLGIWLTGAAGFIGAKVCFKYLFYEILPGKKQISTILYSSLLGLVIIVIAAWLEAFVTIKQLIFQ